MGNKVSSTSTSDDSESDTQAKERDKQISRSKDKKEKKSKKNKKESKGDKLVAPSPRVDGADNALLTGDGSFQEGSMAGSLLTSMMVAHRNFTESLRQVQTEDQPLMTLARMTHFDVPTLRSLQQVFTAISCHDANDNLISAEELCRATGTHPGSLLGRALFRLLDMTKANNINFRAWVLMLSKLSPQASLDDKIGFAFNLYDGDGDGYIDKAEVVAMLRQAISDLSEEDARAMIAHAFDQVDADRDHRINFSDYRLMASASQDFYEAFTIDVPLLLAQYNVLSHEEARERVVKLRERDLRQDEKMNTPANQAREQAFMEREEDDLHVVVDIDSLDID
jgi:Ca2+-binding EF-hand superfamily protein